MKNSKTYKFDKGIEIWANHDQALRSKLSTPTFFKNPPPHPGLKLPDNKKIYMLSYNGTERLRSLLNSTLHYFAQNQICMVNIKKTITPMNGNTLLLLLQNCNRVNILP